MDDCDAFPQAIKSLKAECESKGWEADWFLFGSFLGSNLASSDIDLLVVTTDFRCKEVIRSALEETLLVFPVDLIIMSKSEEEELNFIAATNARRIA